MIKLKKEQIIVGGLLIVLLGIGIGYILFENPVSEKLAAGLVKDDPKGIELNSNKNNSLEMADDGINKKKDSKMIMVYITGSIKNPGVYNLKEGARLIDLVKKAGGDIEGTDLTKINLAAVIQDGEKIYIPAIGEKKSSMIYSGAETNAIFNSQSDKININQAKKERLEELSGIGPSKAGAIIKYRQENGAFESVKEITEVSGIGPGTFSKIEEEITIR